MPYTHLTQKERYFIYHMRMDGWSSAKIARTLGRHRSTVARELMRNISRWGYYLDDHAERKAAARRLAACRRPCTGDAALMAHVDRKIEARWSPEQIAGRLEDGAADRPGLNRIKSGRLPIMSEVVKK